MRRSRQLAGAILALPVLAAWTTTTAHEFWIEPSTFTPAANELVRVRLCVGDGFEGWSLARNSARVEKFVTLGAGSERPVVGLDGSDPAGVARYAAPGDYVIAYSSNRAFTELPARQFEDYLHEKGLDSVIELRRRHGESDRGAREAYSRHAKALVRVGDTPGLVTDRRMGLRLELVADSDSVIDGADELRSFRLLYQGRPLADALVSAARPGTTSEVLQARTDADGRASFRLHEDGLWRIAAVHMITAGGGVAADWESLWASLTFELTRRRRRVTFDAAPVPTVACLNRVAAATVGTR
jgi:Domain of unknown function (DUF4198)